MTTAMPEAALTEKGVSTFAIRDGIAVLKIDSPPVNALGHAVREALLAGVTRAGSEACDALVIICEGRTFFAGADISEFGKPSQRPSLLEIFEGIEASRKPVVAAIHGTALGGGFELALACHYRIATQSAKVGLPEVNLGLLPGAGGTQRVPRLVGIAMAIDLMVFGKPVAAAKAAEMGLIDAVAGDGNLENDAIAFARKLVDEKRPLRLVRELKVDMDGVEAEAYANEFRAKNKRLFKGFKAPENIIKAIVAASDRPLDDGLARERELFQELVSSSESKAQRYMFFAERTVGKIPGLSKDVKARSFAKSAVIGAGTMGSGITIALLNGGSSVVLIDRDQVALERAVARIEKTIRAEEEKKRITAEQVEQRIARLSTSTELATAVADVDLVIEAVFEKMDLKQDIFRTLDKATKPEAILASNTSFLDLNEIASVVTNPSRVIGLHFFSPANIMRLLEVIRANDTAPDVLQTGMALGKALGKVAVLSGVCHGFIANRMMSVRAEVARQIILHGALPWDVDKVVTDYGFGMGPFAMTDLVGVDVIGWDRENSSSSTVQEILCEQGRWGQKTKAGYYNYDENGRAVPSPEVENIIRDFAAKRAIVQQQFSPDELLRKLLFPVVNEGAKVLEEGIALRASDIDMALVAGYNWPIYTGGPMFWAGTVGLGVIRHWLIANQIEPAKLLSKLADENKTFVD